MGRPEREVVATKTFATFANDLVSCRMRAGVSLRQLAATTGYSPSVLSQAVNGLRLPTEPLLKAYIEGCGGKADEVARWLARRNAELQSIQVPPSPVASEEDVPPAVSPTATIRELRVLYDDVGRPSMSTLSKHSAFRGRKLPKQTISEMLRGRHQPRWATVQAFVEACLDYHDKSQDAARPTSLNLDMRRDLYHWRMQYEAETAVSVKPRSADRDPRQNLYAALRALEDRAKSYRKGYSRRGVTRAVREEYALDLGMGGQRIASWLHPDPASRSVPRDADEVLALVQVWYRMAGQRTTQADQRYWLDLVESAQLDVRSRPSVAQSALGRPLEGISDPFALQVHPVIEVAGATPEPPVLPVLPVYVRRAHDEALDQVVEEVLVGGYTGARMVVLIGGASTGKTRALWEAVQRLHQRSPGWRLWRPRPEALLEALLDRSGMAGLRPRTVLWLNELQGFLDPPDGGLGEDIAAALLDLLTSRRQGPLLVMGTLWPEHLRAFADPARGQDLHAQARALLAGRDVRIAEEWSGPSPALARAAVADPRWKEALDRGRGRPTQYLAGGYDLVRRYENAEPALRAVLDAAGDARRLGHTDPLPIEFLRAAAEGYLSDDIWQQLRRDQRENWFDACLEELERASRGTAGPLTPARPPADGPLTGRLELADYLEQHLRRTRASITPPASLWDAASAHITNAAALIEFATAAENRGQNRHAAQLYRAARDASARGALTQVREEAGHQARTSQADVKTVRKDALQVVSVPADPASLPRLRTATAGFAARLSLSLDVIEDLRIVVDEAASILLAGRSYPGRTLDVSLLIDMLPISLMISGPAEGMPEVTEFSWSVLRALADDVATGADGNGAWIRLTGIGRPPLADQPNVSAAIDDEVAAINARKPQQQNTRDRMVGRPSRVDAEVLASIIQMRERGAALADIADEMNIRAIPTPGGGTRWSPSIVSRLLRTNQSRQLAAQSETR